MYDGLLSRVLVPPSLQEQSVQTAKGKQVKLYFSCRGNNLNVRHNNDQCGKVFLELQSVDLDLGGN